MSGVRELFCRLPLLGRSRGEFDLDLGGEGAGDLLERRQRHAIVIFPLQARDVGLLHADPPREFRPGPTLLQPGSDRCGNVFNDLELAANSSLDKPADIPRISTYGLWMLKV